MGLTDAEIFEQLAAGGRHLVSGFAGFTEAQRLAIPDILEQRPTMLVARTASGKTEAVLAPLLTLLSRERWPGRPSILYVAPTRALVNDLHGRLESRLSAYVDVGRRTGEYREPDSQVLITTPESLDSMLARGWSDDEHRLAGVRAIVLDELHLLVESARGTQLQVLLARLDRVTSGAVLRVALSATVPDPSGLARRYLGSGAAVHVGMGFRSLEIDRCEGPNGIPDRGDGVDALSQRFLRSAAGPNGYAGLAKRLIELRRQLGGLKALVFVPSRTRCDLLSGSLSRFLQGRVPVRVHAHHGSLDKLYRENTEHALSENDEAVAVATSTLEVGIDIGDVGLVVLDGPPGSVSSLLQRVGRGNRRSNTVFVVPVVRNDVEAATLASLLRSAIAGELDECPDTAHYSVAMQQIASILKQARRRPRREGVAELLSAAFGGQSAWIIDQLIASSWLEVTGGGGLRPSEDLADLMDDPMRLHANIGGGGRVVPLVDSVTGEALAWVPRGAHPSKIMVAGASYTQQHRGDVIELTNGVRGGSGKPVRYASRAAPSGRNALRHLARGLGFPDQSLVLQDNLFVHFGGALFGRLLTLGGVKSGPLRSQDDPRRLLDVDVERLVSASWESLEGLCGFGPFQRDLPQDLREEAVVRTVRAHGFAHWVGSLGNPVRPSPEQGKILQEA